MNEVEPTDRRASLLEWGLSEEQADRLLSIPLADQITYNDLRGLSDIETYGGWVLDTFAACFAALQGVGNPPPTPVDVMRRMGEDWLRHLEVEPDTSPHWGDTHLYSDLCRWFGLPELSDALYAQLNCPCNHCLKSFGSPQDRKPASHE